MYELVERKLNNKEIRLLKLRVRGYEKQIHPLYRVFLICGLLGYGTTGLIVLAGNLLAVNKTPLWFTLLIFAGVGTFLFVSVCRSMLRQDKHNRAMIHAIDDVLQNGTVVEEIVKSDRMIEVQELEDEGACYLFEVEDKKLLLLFGQEYYPGTKFPSTDFSLIRILDSKNNPVEFFIEKRGEKLKPYRTIPEKDRLKQIIPYEQKFINCGIDELDEHLAQNFT
jgi:hypothetical protein